MNKKINIYKNAPIQNFKPGQASYVSNSRNQSAC